VGLGAQFGKLTVFGLVLVEDRGFANSAAVKVPSNSPPMVVCVRARSVVTIVKDRSRAAVSSVRNVPSGGRGR
jgi:hypothetical protein